MRQIVLDTETTGIDPAQGHRIIEIGCVEVIDRKLTGRHYHQYIHPEREVEQEAIEVHGITNDFLADKPKFGQIADEFLEFIRGAQLVIHNAAFDIGFINNELKLLKRNDGQVTDFCTVIDTLALAREKHPGQKNNLDALCKRYFVDNSARDLHGALLDAEILADVYLLMTGGQTSLGLNAGNAGQQESGEVDNREIRRLMPGSYSVPVLQASLDELSAHESTLDAISKSSGGNVVWRGGITEH